MQNKQPIRKYIIVDRVLAEASSKKELKKKHQKLVDELPAGTELLTYKATPMKETTTFDEIKKAQ